MKKFPLYDSRQVIFTINYKASCAAVWIFFGGGLEFLQASDVISLLNGSFIELELSVPAIKKFG